MKRNLLTLSHRQTQVTSSFPASVADKHTSHELPTKPWLWLILVVGVLVRFYRLDFHSLWEDEGLQYFVAHAESFQGVFERMYRTFHPPLSFLVNHLFLQLDNSDFFLRLPSALFGIGSLPLCYLLAKRLTSQSAALFAVLVLAMSPFHVWYSQEGRMYAQLLFLSLLSTVVLLRAVERGTWPWWALYTLSITAGMYTHVFMALGVLAQSLWMLLCHRRRLLAYSVSGAAAILLCLPLAAPWVRFFFHRVGLASVDLEALSGEPPKRLGFTWMALPYTFFVYGAGFSLGPSIADLHDHRGIGFLLQFLPIILAVGGIIGAFLMIGILRASKHWDRTSLWLCLLGLGIPLAGVTVLSLMTGFTFNVRYTMVAFPYFCILIGTALVFVYRKNALVGTIAVLALLGISTGSLANHFFNPYYAKEDVRAGVAYWRAASTEEAYLLGSTSKGIKDAINRYLDTSEKSRHIPLGTKQVVAKINAVFSTHKTSSAYVILARDWHQQRENAIRQAFVVEREQAFPGVKILRIVRRES